MPHKIFTSFVYTLISIIILAVIVVFVCLKTISLATNTEFLYFPKEIISAKKQPSISPPLNFMILGLDPRNDSLEKSETTDTIIFSNLTPNYRINLISLPRDLWSYPLNAKINQIYPQSIGRSDQFEYIQQQFSQLLDQPVDRTLVITTQNLIDLVSLVGGVDVNLENGFRDDQYPNPAYVASPSASIPVYITVEFPSGINHLNSQNIAPFVRSRKSAETASLGGTDIGRIQRQQLLLDALLAKIKSPDFYYRPDNLVNLYNFFHQQLQTNLTDRDLFSLGLQGLTHLQNLSFNKINLTTGENPKSDLLYHPKTFINKQWVFIPQDKNYRSFQKFISDSLKESL